MTATPTEPSPPSPPSEASQPARAIPDGPSTPAFWQTFRFVTDPHRYTKKLVEQHGGSFRVQTMQGSGVAIATAELARQVFAAEPESFDAFSMVTAIFGPQSVLATSRTTHRRQRKLLNPRFHGARVKGFLTTMQRLTREHLAAAAANARRSDGLIVMNDLTQALTLDIILETVFGADTSLDRPRGRRILIEVIASVVPVVIASSRFRSDWFPPWKRFRLARAEFDAWVDGMMAARRDRALEDKSTKEQLDDMLGLFQGARYEDGAPMDDAEIRDQIFTLLLAGHETTATSIAWGVHYLAHEPAALASLREAIASLGPNPSPEALIRQPYVEAVASESLRIEPVVTDVSRVCNRDFRLSGPGGDFVVPAGEVIFVLLCGILRDPSLFPEPERFRPERFLERSFSSSEFVPFGGGARRCLGAAFAESELAIALAIIAAEWDVSLVSYEPESSVRRNITMGPKSGVRVRMKRRATD